VNQTGPGLIDAVGLAQLRQSLRSVLTDPDASPLVTISTPTAAPTLDVAAGTVTPTTADDTIRGLVLVLSAREVDSSGGLYAVGDRRLRVMSDDLTVAPTTDSTVTVGADRYRVIATDRSVLPDMHDLLILRRQG